VLIILSFFLPAFLSPHDLPLLPSIGGKEKGEEEKKEEGKKDILPLECEGT
jgi:hypothetical protein